MTTRARIPILSAKTLPDGTVVTAIEWGQTHVILVHQDIMDVVPQDLGRPLLFGRQNVKVEFYTRSTKIIPRSEYDEMTYEHHMTEKPLIAHVRKIEDQT